MDAKRLLLIATVLALLAGVPLLPTATATSAAFTYEQVPVYGNFYVRFTDTTCWDTGVTTVCGASVKWEWKFGDGYMGDGGETTAHRYREAGTYNVTLTVWAEDGTMATVGEEIVVEDSASLYNAAIFLVVVAVSAVFAIWIGSRQKRWWLVVAAAAVLALSGLALLDQVGVL